MKGRSVTPDLAQAGTSLRFAGQGFALGWDLENELPAWGCGLEGLALSAAELGEPAAVPRGRRAPRSPGPANLARSWLCWCCLQPWHVSNTIKNRNNYSPVY